MQYKDLGYNRLMVGDFYHWESDISGNILIRENSQKLQNPELIDHYDQISKI